MKSISSFSHLRCQTRRWESDANPSSPMRLCFLPSLSLFLEVPGAIATFCRDRFDSIIPGSSLRLDLSSHAIPSTWAVPLGDFRAGLDYPKNTQSLQSHANQSLSHSFDPNNIKICFDNFIIIWAQRMWIALKSEEHYFLNFVYF